MAAKFEQDTSLLHILRPAVDFLNGLKTTLGKLTNTLQHILILFMGKDLAEQAERLKTAVKKFKAKAETFEASLAPGSKRSIFRRAPKKIQWTLFAVALRSCKRRSCILKMCSTQFCCCRLCTWEHLIPMIESDILQYSKAAGQAPQMSALSQQELAKIGISVFNIWPAQLAGLANDLKEVLDEILSPVAEHQQSEKLEIREKIQKSRESIEQQSQKYAVALEISLQNSAALGIGHLGVLYTNSLGCSF
jgi:Sec-independent protein translocase protein TatA